MSLKDKAARIDFTSLATAPKEPANVMRPPRTAPGQLMELAASQREDLVARVKELEGQVEALKGLEESSVRVKQLEAELQAAQTELQQWNGAKGARLIEPNDIVLSPFANRHVLNFSSPNFQQLVAEIKSAGGNIQPVKVRPLLQPRDGAHFELVYGHRRHAACLQLGLPVLALVDNVDDQVMFIEMDRENRSRLDLSPWEQGVMYKRGLDMNLFVSARAMSEEIGVHPSTVSRAISIAELPQQIIDAFPSPMEIQYRWAKKLADALETDRESVLMRAEQVIAEKGKLPASKVIVRLLAEEVTPENTVETRLVKVDGKEVAVISVTSKGLQVNIKPDVVAESRLQALTELLARFLAPADNG